MKLFTLQVVDVTKEFKQGAVVTTVLRGVTARFESGHTYAITGSSGSGKSTLLHLLAGLDVPTTGSVFFEKTSLAELKEPELTSFLAHSVGLLFQDSHLIRELSVLENVLIKGFISGMAHDKVYARAIELLTLFGLEEKLYHAPASLSGGQQQLVALARALVNNPKFVLADEPTGNLDAESGKRVMDELVRCVGDGMGLIVCSHDPYVTQRMETVFKLHQGLLVEVTEKTVK